jgi:hypothetical protein
MSKQLAILLMAVITAIAAGMLWKLPLPVAEQPPQSDAISSDTGGNDLSFSLQRPDEVLEILSEDEQRLPVASPSKNKCTITSRYMQLDDGTVRKLISCVPTSPPVEHPYKSYPNDALRALAYSDPLAAEILALRLIKANEEESLSLILRASALSGGSAAPLYKYSNAYPHATLINGEPVFKTIKARYVLDAVAELLGDDRANRTFWEDQMYMYADDPEAELARLNAIAERLLGDMRQIQLDIQGQTNITEGDGDA